MQDEVLIVTLLAGDSNVGFVNANTLCGEINTKNKVIRRANTREWLILTFFPPLQKKFFDSMISFTLI